MTDLKELRKRFSEHKRTSLGGFAFGLRTKEVQALLDRLEALERVREAVKESDIFNRHIEPCRHEYRHCTCGRDEVMEALTTYDTLEKSEC